MESLPEYLSRVINSPILTDSNCNGMQEMVPCRHMEFNDYLKTHDHTYYFSHSTGDRKKLKEKAREIFREP